MYLSEYLCHDCVIAELTARNKDQVLRELASVAKRRGLNEDLVYAVLLEREKLGTTAVGGGIAIPHGKMAGIDSMLLFFARSTQGVDFDAADKRPCHFFFAVLAPEGAAGQHLGMLGAIARRVRDAAFITRLTQAQNAEELADFLSAV